MAGIAVALVVSLVLAAIAIPVGPRVGMVDRPDGTSLKVHSRPAVPLGGIGIYVGVHLGMSLEGIFDPGLATATGGLLVLGLLDDRFRLTPRLRLIAEVVLAGILVVFGSGGWSNGPLAALLGVGLVVSAINAVNLFDGLDGLAGLSALVAAVGVAALADFRGLNGVFGLIVAAALVGFLVLNWHPARVFLGDNGAYVVGAFLAYGIMRISPGAIDSRVIVASVLLGVFALDLTATIIRRRLVGTPLFAGDRSHLYDQLRDREWTVRRVALTMAVVQLGYVAIALGLERVPSGLGRVVLVGAAGISSLLLVRFGGFLLPQTD